jgi:hypothetical protein
VLSPRVDTCSPIIRAYPLSTLEGSHFWRGDTCHQRLSCHLLLAQFLHLLLTRQAKQDIFLHSYQQCTSYPTFLNSRPSWISEGGSGHFNSGDLEFSLLGVAGGSAVRAVFSAELAARHGALLLRPGSDFVSLRSSLSVSVASKFCLGISRSLWSLSLGRHTLVSSARTERCQSPAAWSSGRLCMVSCSVGFW